MDSDAQLVARVQRGDPDAFASLLSRHQGRVFRLALSILGREFAPEAEDVAQEVFLKVHHAIQSFRGEAQFTSWIYRITFNQALNVKERARLQRPHLEEAVLEKLATLSPGPDRQFETARRDQVIEECIQTLPELYQSAMRQHYWLGVGIGEIAESLDVPENSVKSYLHRGRKLLRGMLNERGLQNG